MNSLRTMTEEIGAQAAIEHFLCEPDLDGTGRNNIKPIGMFMEDYKGKKPYLAFVTKNIPMTVLGLWVQPGLDYEKLDKAMLSMADAWAYQKREEEAAKAAEQEKEEVTA